MIKAINTVKELYPEADLAMRIGRFMMMMSMMMMMMMIMINAIKIYVRKPSCPAHE